MSIPQNKLECQAPAFLLLSELICRTYPHQRCIGYTAAKALSAKPPPFVCSLSPGQDIQREREGHMLCTASMNVFKSQCQLPLAGRNDPQHWGVHKGCLRQVEQMFDVTHQTANQLIAETRDDVLASGSVAAEKHVLPTSMPPPSKWRSHQLAITK